MVSQLVMRSVAKGRPHGWLHLFFRLPVVLHRFGLRGFERLLGVQWMLITTRGRKTGRPHQVMVDVIGRNALSDTYYVVAAYGVRSDWLRNIEAHPIIQAQVGRRSVRARAQVLSGASAEALMLEFMSRNPTYSRVAMVLAGLRFENDADLRQQLRQWTVLAIEPQTPPHESAGRVL